MRIALIIKNEEAWKKKKDWRKMPLKYQIKILEDALAEDNLTVIARGLGKNKILANLLKIYSDPSNLVLVLNCSNSEQKHFVEEIKLSGHKHLPCTLETTTDRFAHN